MKSGKVGMSEVSSLISLSYGWLVLYFYFSFLFMVSMMKIFFLKN